MEPGQLRSMHRMMLTIRLAEESFVPVINDGTVEWPVHLYTGQEAIAAGLCGALADRDYVFGSHRSHGHFLGEGGTLRPSDVSPENDGTQS